MNNTIRTTLIGISLGLYGLLFFLFDIEYLPFTWLLLVFILLNGTKKWKTRWALLILSAVVTYLPIFLFFREELLILGFLIHAAIYTYLLRDMWHKGWSKKGVVIALLSFVVLVSTANFIFDKCDYVSAAEKGVSIEEIKFCKFFDQYSPPASNKFSGMDNWIVYSSITGPRNLAVMMLLTFFYFYAEEKKLTLKITSKNKKSTKIGAWVGMGFSILGLLSTKFHFVLLDLITNLNPFPFVFGWLMHVGVAYFLYLVDFTFFTILSVLITLLSWTLIGMYWKLIWKKKYITIPIYLLLVILHYWLMNYY